MQYQILLIDNAIPNTLQPHKGWFYALKGLSQIVDACDNFDNFERKFIAYNFLNVQN